MTGAEARRRFAEARVAHLATADASGRPHLVPIVFALAGDTVYSAIDGKPKRSTALRRLANVASNPESPPWSIITTTTAGTGCGGCEPRVGPGSCLWPAPRHGSRPGSSPLATGSMPRACPWATCWPSTSIDGRAGRGRRHEEADDRRPG